MKLFINYINELAYEDIYNYYIVENHSFEECLEKFNVKQNMFFRILRYFNIKKSKKQSAELVKATKKKNFGYANYNGHAEFIFEFSELAEADICKKYLEGYSIRQLNNLYHTHKTNNILIKSGIQLRTQEENRLLKTAKIKQTCLERYGTDNIAKCTETVAKIKQTWTDKPDSEVISIKRKSWKKYLYDEVYFDSSWELYYYIWCKDNMMDIIKPQITLIYEFEGRKHRYIPDFLVNGRLVEIKGDYLFKKLIIENTIDNAKYNCMLKNNVQILTYTELQQIFEQVDNKYGKNYLEQFKISA